MKKNNKFGLCPKLSEHDAKIVQKAQQEQREFMQDPISGRASISMATIRKFTNKDMCLLANSMDIEIAQHWIYELTDIIDPDKHAISDEKYTLIILSKLNSVSKSFQKYHTIIKNTCSPIDVIFQNFSSMSDLAWYTWYEEAIKGRTEDKLAELLLLLLDFSGVKHLTFGDIYERYKERLHVFHNFDEFLYSFAFDLVDDMLSTSGNIYCAIADIVRIFNYMRTNEYQFIVMRIRYYILLANKMGKISFE